MLPPSSSPPRTSSTLYVCDCMRRAIAPSVAAVCLGRIALRALVTTGPVSTVSSLALTSFVSLVCNRQVLRATGGHAPDGSNVVVASHGRSNDLCTQVQQKAHEFACE
jgi:hypothetical protein